MPKNKTPKFNKTDEKLYAFLATFFCIIGVLLILLLNKRTPYTLHYARQGIVIFIFWLIAIALGMIPFFGWAIWILFAVVWIMAWVNALSGETRHTWLISEFAIKIKL